MRTLIVHLNFAWCLFPMPERLKWHRDWTLSLVDNTILVYTPEGEIEYVVTLTPNPDRDRLTPTTTREGLA